jgi:hypothetical protein
MLAKLGHGDAAQGQRRRIVAQGDPLERAERVAGSKGARGGGDQGVHDDMATPSADVAPCVGLHGHKRALLPFHVSNQPLTH